MTSQELKNAYKKEYDYMANSQDTEDMKVFGKVMTEMFTWYADNKPDAAQEWLDRLSAIRWDNYLTPKEAQRIVDGMNPKAPWSREVWNSAMDSLGLQKEEEPYYNKCALWVVMNQVYTDHAQTIADKIIKKPLSDIPADQIVPGIYALALDLLFDKDGRYSVREYFGL